MDKYFFSYREETKQDTKLVSTAHSSDRPWCSIGFIILGFFNVRYGSEGEKGKNIDGYSFKKLGQEHFSKTGI